MRRLTGAIVGSVLAVFLAGPVLGQTQLIPEKRMVLTADTDMPGSDLSKIFDTSVEACLQACFADANCKAITYNQRSRACFPKGDGAQSTPFVGAVSGRVMVTPDAVQATATKRAEAAKWLTDSQLDEAREQARVLATSYDPVAGDPRELMSQAQQAANSGSQGAAMRLFAAATAQTDSSAGWTAMARTLLGYTDDQTSRARVARLQAINGYLRATTDDDAALALAQMARAMQRIGAGQDSIAVLGLARELAPSDQLNSAYEAAIREYGFRVTDHQVSSSGAAPGLCVNFSEPLAEEVDFAPFVRTQQTGLSIEANGAQLCAEGLSYGEKAELTLRRGLPAASGLKLERDVTVSAFIRDRNPLATFAGRAYVLPRGGNQTIDIKTINTRSVDLTLLRMSDRNLIRSFRDDLFGNPMDSWESDSFTSDMAEEVWKGTADVAGASDENRNEELTTGLNVTSVAGPLEPGVYVLQARLPKGVAADSEELVAAQWFVISDLGMASYLGADGLTVAVRGLGDAQPREGIDVALMSRANGVLGRARTDAQGVARFDAGLTRGEGTSAPALVTASVSEADGTPTDMAFLSLISPEFDLSDRGVEGQPPAPPIDVFLTTDRGAYRAGETVNTTILARDDKVAALQNLPLTAVLLRPDGVEQQRATLTDSGAGGYILSLQLPDTAPRGAWQLQVRAEADGPALASTRVLVEDFLPERIDFALDVPTGIQELGATIPVGVDARWLYGAPAANLPVEVTLGLQRATAVEGYKDFRFGPHDLGASAESNIAATGETDETGKFQADITIPETTSLATVPIEATIAVSVREGAGRPVERTEKRLVMPGSPVVGIKPDFEDDTVNESSKPAFRLALVGPDGKPVAGEVKWTVNRVRTEYQWYAVGGSWNWEPLTRREKVDEGTVSVAADGYAEITTQVEWGEYELIAKPSGGAASAEGVGLASVSFFAGWGAPANSGTPTPDRLSVSLDKRSYKSGDTAQVTIDAISDGVAVISVMSNRLVSLQSTPVKAGLNTVELPVTDEWGAGVYVAATTIRPLDSFKPGEREPIRALGLVHAGVDPGARKLNATLTAPEQALPRADLPVTLAVDGGTQGQTVYATIAAVDQGILNLTGFKSPDPAKHYFGQRRLGVGIRDLYGRLILPSGAPDGAVRTGGGEANMGGFQAPPPTEKLMSWFSGPITLGPDGTAQVQVPVPDFNGEIALMAVVWTDKAVGQATGKAVVSDPVVMTVTAPRFLAPGDKAEIGLALDNVSAPAGQVSVSATDNGGNIALGLGDMPAPITLAEKARGRMTLPITAPTIPGLAQVRLSLTPPGGGPAVTKDIAIPVRSGRPEIAVQTREELAPGQSLSLDAGLISQLVPGTATVTLAAGPFAQLDVPAALGQLRRYPYGCTEQVTSVAMPLLYLSSLSELTGRPETGDQVDETAKSINDVIATIASRQTGDGAFGLWSADSGYDTWLTAYATDFLSRARATGYDVPDATFKSAIANLQSAVNRAGDPQDADKWEMSSLAYALNVLARERAASIGDLRYYADEAASRFETPLSAAMLGSALAAYGDQQRADRMFSQAARTLDKQGVPLTEPQTWRDDYGTNMRDRAAILALAAQAGSEAIDAVSMTADLARQLDRRAQNRGGLSTQEALWTVLAAQGLAQGGQLGVTLNGAAMEQAVTRLPDLATTSSTVANTGSQPTIVTVTGFGLPADPALTAGGKGYAITRQYFTLEGKPTDPTLVPLGTRMVAVLEVQPFDDMGGGRLIVNDPLPAGFEIDNPNLLRSGDISALDWIDGITAVESAQFLQDRFIAAVDWRDKEAFKLAYILRAVTPGEFEHPAASVEDMYRPEYRAWTAAGRSLVVP
ncbi:alpha-2-macroglobulin family protein [Paracoccus pacificus]|uniref:Alpha-2-macroglobulin family protein n=1 Tax=Paracoccus pacificus TaxID=1463598 RepID=A0ABW4R8L3_9RHOB